MKNFKIFITIFVIIFVYTLIINLQETEIKLPQKNQSRDFKIISSTENKDLEEILLNYAAQNDINLQIEYAGTIEIMDKLNSGEKYDAVWTSNSIWLYMLKDKSVIKDSKSTSINPIVFGIKKSKAESLGFVGKDIYTKDIVDAVFTGNLKFIMTSASRTNTGASAYLAFLTTLAGSPEVLTEGMLNNEELKEDLVNFFSGVQRSSGSEEFLEDISSGYDAMINYEASFININKNLQDPYYLIYPIDGVPISDSPFAYIDNSQKKEEVFKEIQSFILSEEAQRELGKTGRRVWYGGINESADKTVFNPNWGIDTTKYLIPVKYPNTDVIKTALGMYQSELRKPTHIVFCLDYSGSMSGNGITQLSNAMQYILDEEKASEDLLQFSTKDKITVIPFSSDVLAVWETNNGIETEELIKNILGKKVGSNTNIYGALIKALQILDLEDNEKYNLSIVLMTDGEGNVGTFWSLKDEYSRVDKDIPVYSIMFGDAREYQLNEIKNLTNGKVFNGKTNLLEAFKEVRGYN